VPTYAVSSISSITLVIVIKTSKLPAMKRLLPFLLLLVSSVSFAESGAYRVEVIIFRNLFVAADATVINELRSFSHYPDLEDTRPPGEPVESTAGELTPELPAELADTVRNDLPDDVIVSTERGTYMDDVWRRLRSSEGYRPLLYTSWEQNRVDYYPPMRVHNQQVIDTQLRPLSNIIVADLTAEDPLGAYRSNFYQLDGSVQLRRSRFLHLYLDLEYRDESPQNNTDTGTPASYDFLSGAEEGASDISEHSVFTLKQNRQIRTNAMQYFDTPFFGALVFVTSIVAAPPMQ
jgi:hypothetical protein